jgi:hypothetical protein
LPTDTAYGASFSPSDNAIAVSSFTASQPVVSVYPWINGSGFGTKYSNPATAVLTNARENNWNPAGNVLVIAGHTSPRINAYAFSAGWGSKYADPATIPTGDGVCPAFNTTGTTVAVAHSTTPFISVYPWSAGFGTKYANPATLPAGAGEGVAFA